MCSIRFAAAFGSPRRLAATIPRLGCPDQADPDFVGALAPDSLGLSDGYHPSPGAAPSVSPYPVVHLLESAQFTPSRCIIITMHIIRCVAKTRIVLEGVWNHGVTVAADDARDKGYSP
jgi:hypothetical protein